MKIREIPVFSDDGFTIIDPRTFDFFFLKGKGKILPCKRPIRRSTILCRRREKELRPIGLPSNWNSQPDLPLCESIASLIKLSGGSDDFFLFESLFRSLCVAATDTVKSISLNQIIEGKKEKRRRKKGKKFISNLILEFSFSLLLISFFSMMK